MITALNNNQAKRITPETKLNIALAAMRQKQTIVELSKRYDCSRSTIYQQKNKVLAAANKAFEAADDEILFYIPVTKKLIHQVVISLYLICKSSYRDIQYFLKGLVCT